MDVKESLGTTGCLCYKINGLLLQCCYNVSTMSELPCLSCTTAKVLRLPTGYCHDAASALESAGCTTELLMH